LNGLDQAQPSAISFYLKIFAVGMVADQKFGSIGFEQGSCALSDVSVA
jgi:hypothetical protein